MVDWNKAYESGRDFRAISQQDISDFIKDILPVQGKRSLDIGCGTGQLTRELWHRGLKPTGIDISESAIRLAKSYTVLGSDEINYQVFNLETSASADLTDKQFSLITCKLVYAFIEDKDTFLCNVTKLLADDGVFVILTPLKGQVPLEKAHIAVVYEDTVKEIERYFTIIETRKDEVQMIFTCRLR